MSIGREPAGQDWFGFERTVETVEGVEREVIAAPVTAWPADHRRRLLQTPMIDGLVPVLAVERLDDTVRAHQPLVAGQTFAEMLSAERQPQWRERAGVIEAAAAATEQAHEIGLVHGALGPGDIVVNNDAVAVRGMGLTRGAALGAGSAIAPEVGAGQAPTAAADVFGLGAMLRTAIGDNPAAPAALTALAAAATQVDPSLRPGSAGALAAAIRDAGGPSMPTYAPMAIGAAAPMATALDSGSAPAAAAAADPTKRSRRVAAGGAALLGLGALAFWAASPNDTETTEAPVTTLVVETNPVETTPIETTPIETTAPPSTAEVPTSVQPTSVPSTSVPSSTAPSTTAEVPTTVPSTTVPSSTVTSTTVVAATSDEANSTAVAEVDPAAALSAVDAANEFEILAAVPGTTVDVYLDGELGVEGLAPAMLAGPLPVTGGADEVAFYPAAENPPSQAASRPDAPLLETDLGSRRPGIVALTETPAGLELVDIASDLTLLPAGQARVVVASTADSALRIEVAADSGAPVQLSAGTAVVDAGPVDLLVFDAAGAEIARFALDAAEGQLTTAVLVAPDADPTGLVLVVRRVDHLGSPPTGVPSGTGGLVSIAPDGLVPAVIVMLALSAAGQMLQRRRAT